jgi:hypothetical protein
VLVIFEEVLLLTGGFVVFDELVAFVLFGFVVFVAFVVFDV